MLKSCKKPLILSLCSVPLGYLLGKIAFLFTNLTIPYTLTAFTLAINSVAIIWALQEIFADDNKAAH